MKKGKPSRAICHALTVYLSNTDVFTFTQGDNGDKNNFVNELSAPQNCASGGGKKKEASPSIYHGEKRAVFINEKAGQRARFTYSPLNSRDVLEGILTMRAYRVLWVHIKLIYYSRVLGKPRDLVGSSSGERKNIL